MPFWLSLLITFFAIVYFPFYFESVFLFLISDFIFGIKSDRFFNIMFISGVVAFLSVVIIEFSKKKIRFLK